MKKKSEEKEEALWDCVSFPCADSCCQYGVDVYPNEREILISRGLATVADFEGPETDKKGVLLYRTRTGSRGCVFLHDDRGCRLHSSGYKPAVCCQWPRNYREAKRAAESHYLPCFPFRYNRKPDRKNKTS